ncbi:cation transporter [Gemella sp. GH3]|uniref:cation diffusion facilitator family transporter n=1 Tax=unclassified Gemella TaxID=2624949 RepID=UPI0015D02B3A|nr:MULTISPECIES: cation diffusion facilitator family transporter [unclassified Gemella]MBF0714224.1 cation transporter [Gemella sp. GH3.1]NYS51176.1 cation transporter [Gemella sp. GH3]
MNNKSIFDNLKKAERGAKISILAYLISSSLKLIFGFSYNSSALIADGINNATDVIASLAVLIGLKISRKPADENHLYGHFRAELISSLIASFIMMYAGIQVVIFAIKNLISNDYPIPTIETAILALISTIVMLIVFYYNFNLAKKINSSSLKAAALDNLSDALVSIGTLVGILGSIVGVKQADSIAATIVGLIIIYTAINIFKDATHILTDGIEVETIEKIKKIVSNIEEVIEIKEIRGRSHGLIHFIDVTVTVNPNLNVIKSHDITVEIEKALQQEFFACETLVHLEPYYNNIKK